MHINNRKFQGEGGNLPPTPGAHFMNGFDIL